MGAPDPRQALDGAGARDWVEAFLRELAVEREGLGELDRRSGDGDYGNNLRTALSKAQETLAAADERSAGAPFAALSAAFLGTGGTSGPLYGMWFRELARAGAGEELDLDAIAAAAAAGLAAVQRLGRAEVGDKTMVDAMAPAATALTEAAAEGRASYVGEVSRGVLDPGAVTVAIFFEAAEPALRGHQNHV